MLVRHSQNPNKCLLSPFLCFDRFPLFFLLSFFFFFFSSVLSNQWDPERDGDCPRVLAWDSASKQEYYIKVPPSDHGPAGADGGSGSSK